MSGDNFLHVKWGFRKPIEFRCKSLREQDMHPYNGGKNMRNGRGGWPRLLYLQRQDQWRQKSPQVRKVMRKDGSRAEGKR